MVWARLADERAVSNVRRCCSHWVWHLSEYWWNVVVIDSFTFVALSVLLLSYVWPPFSWWMKLILMKQISHALGGEHCKAKGGKTEQELDWHSKTRSKGYCPVLGGSTGELCRQRSWRQCVMTQCVVATGWTKDQWCKYARECRSSASSLWLMVFAPLNLRTLRR